MRNNFNVAFINQCTEAEGPGKHLAIWFQGCDKRCFGCCNPELFDFKQANILSLDEMLKIIINAKNEFNIIGVTYLGGEPTLQNGLLELSKEIRKADLGIILFTGNKAEEIDNNFFSAVDIIIDGKYEIDKPDNKRNLVGSANQNIIFITERYKKNEDWFYNYRPKQLEININDGIFITGDKAL